MKVNFFLPQTEQSVSQSMTTVIKNELKIAQCQRVMPV